MLRISRGERDQRGRELVYANVIVVTQPVLVSYFPIRCADLQVTENAEIFNERFFAQPPSRGKGGEESPRSEEHTSELQSLMRISYAVFCLKKNDNKTYLPTTAEENKTELKTIKH